MTESIIAHMRRTPRGLIEVSARVPGHGTVRYASPHKHEAVDAVMTAVAVLTAVRGCAHRGDRHV